MGKFLEVQGTDTKRVRGGGRRMAEVVSPCQVWLLPWCGPIFLSF